MTPAAVDHVVYAAPELTAAIGEIEQLTGIRAAPGGRHPGWGTQNALIALGPAAYLEIIAPDREQAPPERPRPFGIDGLAAGRVAGWAAKGQKLERLRERAEQSGVPLGAVLSGSRRRPDGTVLSWRLTDLFTTLSGGIIPFFIDWGDSPHPAEAAPGGLSLVQLRAEHPEPGPVQAMLTSLGLNLIVTPGPQPVLAALIETGGKRFELR